MSGALVLKAKIKAISQDITFYLDFNGNEETPECKSFKSQD